MQTYFLIVGLVAMVFGWVLLCRRLEMFIHGGRATGKIVDVTERKDLETGEPIYEAVIAFTTSEWRDVRFTASRGSINKKPEIGKSLPILYNRDMPQKAFVGDFLGFWAAPVAFFVLGLGGLAAGVGFHLG